MGLIFGGILAYAAKKFAVKVDERVEAILEVLPGATAITTALVYSGLDTTKFIFRGFIPRETKERKILIEEIKDKKEMESFINGYEISDGFIRSPYDYLFWTVLANFNP